MKKIFISLLILFSVVLTKCNYDCGQPDYKRFYGKWKLEKISNTKVTAFNNEGTIEFNKDKSFKANFSYFFTFDTLHGSDSLVGTWWIPVDNYQGICSEELELKTYEKSKTYDFHIDSLEMRWIGWKHVIYWKKVK